MVSYVGSLRHYMKELRELSECTLRVGYVYVCCRQSSDQDSLLGSAIDSASTRTSHVKPSHHAVLTYSFFRFDW